MEFKRARSKDQKDQRLEEIISVACDLYKTNRYEKITMASIAKELSFSRVSLYSYAATKEEIFLLVLTRDHKELREQILHAFEGKENISIKEFADLWAKTYYEFKRLLSLYSILLNIIEKNVSLEKLIQFKNDFVDYPQNMVSQILSALPFLTAEDFYKFEEAQFHFLRGLYPATQDNPTQVEAIKLSGIQYRTPDFVESFSEFIEIYLESSKRKRTELLDRDSQV